MKAARLSPIGLWLALGSIVPPSLPRSPQPSPPAPAPSPPPPALPYDLAGLGADAGRCARVLAKRCDTVTPPLPRGWKPPAPPAPPAPLGVEMARPASQPDLAPPGSGLRVIVSLASQRLYVLRGGLLVATSPVSTGKPGHGTPAGTFPILEKQVFHRSNKYSNAPMPYMQRLTNYGIALHAGRLPGYPASHGCIRLPAGFARTLFGMTRPGTIVTVTRARWTPPHRKWRSWEED